MGLGQVGGNPLYKVTVTWTPPSPGVGFYLPDGWTDPVQDLQSFTGITRHNGNAVSVVTVRGGRRKQVNSPYYRLFHKDPCNPSSVKEHGPTDTAYDWVNLYTPPVGVGGGDDPDPDDPLPPGGGNPPIDDPTDPPPGPGDPGPDDCDDPFVPQQCNPFENEDTREPIELGEAQNVELVSEIIYFSRYKNGFPTYTVTPAGEIPKIYLTETADTNLQGGTPESPVGGHIVRKICRLTGELIITEKTGNPSYYGVRPSDDAAITATTWLGSFEVRGYDDCPNQEPDEPGEMLVSAELSQEYTTDILKEDLFQHSWKFKGIYANGQPTAHFNVGDSELWADYSKVRYKIRVPESVSKPYNAVWVEEFTPEDDNPDDGIAPEKKCILKSAQISGAESQEYVIDPATNPDEEGSWRVYLLNPRFEMMAGHSSTLSEIGVTNRAPLVELDEIATEDVSVSGDQATVTIGGTIRDAIMDNFRFGSNAEIKKAKIFVNNEEWGEVNLTRSQDGAPSSWRQYPSKLTIPSTVVTIPKNGIATIRIETEDNLAGIKGYDSIDVAFEQNVTSGGFSPDTITGHTLIFGGALSPTVADSVVMWRPGETSGHTLDETGPNTNVFTTPSPTTPTDPVIKVTVVGTYAALGGVETIKVNVEDSASPTAGTSQGILLTTVSEDPSMAGRFAFSQIIPGEKLPDAYTYEVVSVTNAPNMIRGGEFPFTWKVEKFGVEEDAKLGLGSSVQKVVTIGDSYYPKAENENHVAAYLIFNETSTSPQFEVIFCDPESGAVKRLSVGGIETGLNMKVIASNTTANGPELLASQIRLVGADGGSVENLQHVSVQALIDLLEGDSSIEISDDSWQKVRVKRRELAEGSVEKILVQSSEIPSDFFYLSTEPMPGKWGELVQVSEDEYESADKIIVYNSAEGVETLTESQWVALKNRGYLAVHNLEEKYQRVVDDVALDLVDGAPQEEHHIFNKWQKDTHTRYRDFWNRVFDEGEFDKDDFTVKISRKRHKAFTPECTERWKTLINGFTNPDGSLKPEFKKSDIKRAVIDKALEMADDYKIPLQNLRRYRSSIPLGDVRASTLDKLIKLDSFDGRPRFDVPNDLKANRWKKVVKLAEKKFGKKILKALPYVGLILNAQAAVQAASDPTGYVAETLDITRSGAEALLEGKATLTTALWNPGATIDQAQLSDGTVIGKGDPYYFAYYYTPSREVYAVDEGEVEFLVATDQPGYVNVHVRYGQERREYKDIHYWKPGIPSKGHVLPPGW